MYFICLHDKLFSNYNKTIGIYNSIDISDENIYLYSPVELSADGFAYQIIDKLRKYDIQENYDQYRNFHSQNYYKMIQRNALNGGNLTSKSISHSLQSALYFLNYKNYLNNSSIPYLNINVTELEQQVAKASKKWIEKENKEIEVYNKIIKKR